MNIFYLDHNYQKCAQMHCDQHVRKMILEYAQMLSTAHRVLDGTPSSPVDGYVRGETLKQFKKPKVIRLLPDEGVVHFPTNEDIGNTVARLNLYLETHTNHKSNVWIRNELWHYNWLYAMWYELCDEYFYRFGKRHVTQDLSIHLYEPPKNIPKTMEPFAPPPQAMDQFPQFKVEGNTVEAYHNFYRGDKIRFATWTRRPKPEWMI